MAKRVEREDPRLRKLAVLAAPFLLEYARGLASSYRRTRPTESPAPTPSTVGRPMQIPGVVDIPGRSPF